MKHLRHIFSVGMLIALVASASAQSWLTNGLVVYYPFNGNANNEAGSGFNGTVNGPQTGNDRFGNASSAYYFNGAGNHIYVGDQLPDSQEFTLSVWIRSDEDKVQGVFYDAALFTPGRDTILNISVGRNMYGTATKPGVPINDPLVAPAAVAIGIWQHVVWTVRTNGSAIYINGILADASTDIGNNIGYHSAIYIGTENHGFGPDYFFHGSMDDLRIYTRGLTQTEVQQLYAYESGSSVTSFTNGLVAYYPFDGNGNDQSGNGNSATPVGNYQYLSNGLSGGAIRIIGDGSLFYAGGGHVLLPTFGGSINSEYSFSLWVKDEVIGGWPVGEEAYIAFGSLSLKRAEMWINSGFGGVKFAFDDGSGTGIETNSIATDLGLTWPTYLSSWKHLVFTYTAGVMSGYVNGQKRVEVFRAYNIFPVATAALGRHWWDSGASSSARMSCTYDSVRIYNRALSTNDVAQLYAYESGSSSPTFTNGLMAYYPFNGNANDETGSGNSGNLVGANLTMDRFGHTDAALFFDGVNDYADFSISNLPTAAQPRTLSLWMRSDFSGQRGWNEHFAGYGRVPPLHAFGFLIGSDSNAGHNGRLIGYLGYDDTYTPFFVATSVWNFVVHTYDGEISRVYVNGNLVGQEARIAATEAGTPFSLGARYAPESGQTYVDFFKGAIDDVRIYNRALSSNEVTQLYAQESVPPGLVYDDFSSTSVDTNIWEIRKTFSDSDVFVSSGNLVELNGGKLLKVGAAPTNVVISTRFKFAGNQNDVFRIVWRSNGDDSNVQNGARELLNGLRLSFQRPHSENGFVGSIGFDWINHPIAGGVIGTVQTNLLANTYYDVRIEDDGSQINIFFGSDPTPMFTGVFSPRYGDRLAFYNREGSGGGSSISAGSRVELDYIGIQDVAQTVLPPSIATQPQAISAMAGSATNFSVVATGSAPLKYQWRKDGATIPGATNASLALSNLQLSAMGNYSVVITNLAGSVTSSAAILKVSEWVVTTIAGSGLVGLSNGPALQASFNGIDELKVFPQGGMEVLVVDAGNNNVRSISGGLNPEVDVYAGSQSGSSGTNLGAPHDARFNLPLSVALGATGQVYVADTFNHRIVSIAPGTRVVSLLAGSGVAGVTDGASASASFDFPNDLAVDSAGNVFVSEFNHHVIRKITPAGQVMLFAGDGTSGYQDGEGLQARFNKPGALAIDLNDNLYVGEYVGNRVRKITPAGFVTTVAGSGMAGYADGMGTNAQFDTIASVCVDNEGNLYVGDLNRVIRQITPSGLVQTIAGTGGIGFEDGPGRSAVFRGPAGLGWHPDGSLLVADDSGSERIRRVAKVTGAVAPSLVQQPVSVVTAAGGTVVFKTAATGSWPISYQWQKDGVNLPGENGPSLLLTNVQPTRIGDYAVIVVNGSGSATSSVASVSIPGVNSGLWQGLVAYYPFNGNTKDESQSGNDGIVSGAVLSFDRFGQPNKSLRFPEDPSSMSAQGLNFPTGARAKSLSVWVKPESLVGLMPGFASFGGINAQGNAFGLGYGPNSNAYFWGHGTDIVGTGQMTTNSWFHLCATMDSAGNVTLYQNSQVLGSLPNSGLNTSEGGLLLGRWFMGGGFVNQLIGSLDEVRIYNRALSSTEVAQLYSYEFPDADKDGLSDYEEVNILGTDPNKSDTDGDGLTDLQEVRFRNTNPTLADTDGDGFNDYAEIYTAHDPLLNTDYPAANLSAFTAIELEFVTKVGTTYQLQTSPDLVTWTNFDNAIIGDGNLWKKTYPTRGQGRLFHRVESAP